MPLSPSAGPSAPALTFGEPMAPSLHSSFDPGSPPIRLVLVDDSAELRTLLRMRFRLEHGIDVVAEAGDGETAYEVVAAHDPDVVLTDLRMPTMDGIQLTSALGCTHPHVAVVVMTGLPDPEARHRALEAGASAFVEKSPEIDLLIDLVREVSLRRGLRAMEEPRS